MERCSLDSGCSEPESFLDSGTPATILMGRVFDCQAGLIVPQLMENKSGLNFLCCRDAPCITVGSRRAIR